MRHGKRGFVVVGSHADHQRVVRDAAGHVAAHHEAQAAEHASLVHVGREAEMSANALSQPLVVGHVSRSGSASSRRERDERLVATGVDTRDAEQVVVDQDPVERDLGGARHEPAPRPVGIDRVAPVDSISRHGPGRRLPTERGRSAHGAANPDRLGRRRRGRERGERGGVDAGDPGRIGEVDRVGHVAVGDAVLRPQILMLAVVVLVRFGQPHRRVAEIVEGAVVAAAAEPVEPVDQLRPHRRLHQRGDPMDVSGQLPGVAVHFAAHHPARAGLGLRFRRRHRLREDPERHVVDVAADAGGVADDVVVEHALDRPPVLLRVLRQLVPAEQSLLLAGQRGVDDRLVEAMPAQQAGGLDHGSGAAGVVVGARRVRLGVHRPARAGIVVARDQHVPVGIPLAPLNGHHVDQLHAPGDPGPGPALQHAALERHLEAPAAGPADRVELGVNPAPRRPDAPGRRHRIRQRVPGAEGRQLPDRGLDRGRRNPVAEGLQPGVVIRWRRRGLEEERGKQRNRQ